MKLALIQMNSVEALEPNLRKAERLIDEAVAAHRPDLIVLPEFFNRLYFAQYRDYRYIDWAEREDGPTLTAIRNKARQHGTSIIATVYEESGPGVYYDTAFVIDPEGRTAGCYRKTHPAAEQSLEKIYFRYGSRFPVFPIGDLRVGINICYDTWFPESARVAALNGADLIVVPFAARAKGVWRSVMRARAFENGVYFAPCNKVGQEGEQHLGGSSMIVDPLGEVLAEAGDADETCIAASLSRDTVYAARRSLPMWRDRRPDLYRAIATEMDVLQEQT
jgi:N-carbamoylputrescine amidase